LDDLTENLNLAQAFKERPELVRAWEVALGQQVIRTDVGWLNRIEGWLADQADKEKIARLVDEVVENTALLRSSTIDVPTVQKMTLKEAFEGDFVEFDAWRRVDEGIPSLKNIPSEYLLYLKKMTKYSREIGTGPENVKVYRVQGGGAGFQTSQERIELFKNGDIGIADGDELYISTGSMAHAIFYANGIPPYYPASRPGGQIISFEIPRWLDEQMKSESIPQHSASSNNFNSRTNPRPQMVDPNRPGDPFGISENWINLFLQYYIRGSGKIEIY